MTTSVPGGAAIRVLIGNHVQTTGLVHIRLQKLELGPALAIVANDQISIDGTLTFGFDDYDEEPAAGGLASQDCTAGPGLTRENSFSGGGGGGYATAGGDGGNVGGGVNPLHVAGGKGGIANGNSALVPLRGGCAGGYAPGFEDYTGGGALQLCSRSKITLRADAILDLNGHAGMQVGGNVPSFGGGSGGGILLEAPSVALGDAARLLVNGAPGVILSGPQATSVTAVPSPGARCTVITCSTAGNGAAIGGPATNGENTYYPNATDYVNTYIAGSGGGGLGYIRINTATANYTKATSTIESGLLTTGAIGTR